MEGEAGDALNSVGGHPIWMDPQGARSQRALIRSSPSAGTIRESAGTEWERLVASDVGTGGEAAGCGIDGESWESVEEPLERHLRLQPGRCGSQAVVVAIAETEHARDPAAHVQQPRIRTELALVVVGGA